MAKAAKQSGRRIIDGLCVRQWLEGWESISWDPKQHQSKPQRQHFYLFSLSAQLLKRLAGIQRRSTKGQLARARDTGIQRFHDQERSGEIMRFVEFGYPWSDLTERKRLSPEFADLRKPGWLPTAIIVNIPRAGTQRTGARLSAMDAIEVQDNGEGKAAIRIPSGAWRDSWQPTGLHPLEVIDGQHRLWAFEDTTETEFQLPVVGFYDLDISWQAYLFWTINIKPKRINPSLAFDLYPLLRSEDWLNRFEGHPIYRETRSQELVEALWSHPESPWRNRINMLGESSRVSGDERPMVSQSAWIRTLMATYVKSWGGPGTRIGGLFGSTETSGMQLSWTRTQQAAFLIYVWQCVEKAVRKSTAPWAVTLREQDVPADLFGKQADLAFVSASSLFTTDPGVRGLLAVTNDLCYVQAESLQLGEWYSDSVSGTDAEAVSRALRSLSKLPVAKFLQELAEVLSSYDWRTSTAPGLDNEQIRSKRALRGSGGYKQMREDLLELLARSRGRVSHAAREVREILRYS